MDKIIKREEKNKDSESTELRRRDVNLAGFDKNQATILLGKIIEAYDIVKDNIPEVEPEKRYYLDLTKEMKDKLGSGECWFTEKKDSGRAMGQLRHRVDGKNKIFANPDIIEEKVSDQLPTNNKSLSESLYQVALIQQMQDISEQIDEIGKSVKNIEIGQMDDRIAKIEAGEDQLRQAYVMEENNNRNNSVHQAIALLQEGSKAMERVIERKVREFEPIPSKERSLKIKMWLSPNNYVDKKKSDFNEIQTYFEYYTKAKQLSAAAYLMINEPNAMEQVLFEQQTFINKLPLDNIKSIKYLYYNIDFSKEWFSSPKSYVDESRYQYLDLLNENYDHMVIEVTGKQIVEVLEND